MERERDAIDELLESLVPAPTYEDIDIVILFNDDPEALDAIDATLPVVHGRRVRAA